MPDQVTAAARNITEELAHSVAAIDFRNLPDEAIARAKLLILDSIGVALAGHDCAIGRIAAGYARTAAGGGPATIMGTAYNVSAASAAFINGTLAHALDMDDTAAGTVAHPSASVLPALLAVSQTRRIDGRTFLAAYITGLEVFFRIALASKGQMGGWHRSAVFGALASAAATAKILELPADGIRAAIGIAAAMTGGLQASFGSMTKAVQVGNAGRAGVVAGLLASDGCTAHTDVLGQPDAFGKAFYSGNFEPEKIVSDFASPLSILDPGIAVKIYPSCGLTHAPADIALSLAHEYDIDSNKVEKVVVYGESFWPDVLIYPEPTTGHQGKYSIPYVVACALVDRRIDPASFTDAAVNRAEIRPCMSKIELATRTDETWNALRQHEWNHPAEVQIEMTGGQTHSQSAECAIGYPDLALSDDDLLAKFKRCASSRLQPASVNALIGRAQELEVVTDVGSIMALTKIPAKD